MKEIVLFHNVSIEIDKGVLFKNITYNFNEGDRYMFFGKNGAGKSLVMELLALGCTNDLKNRYKGLKVTGEIFDEYGNNLLDPNVGRNITYLTQEENFYNNATVLSQAESVCHGAGIDFDESKLDELLNAFNLNDKKRLKIKNNLSNGEGKLIHIITKILTLKTSNILLLDEPLNHLSFKNSKILNDVLNEKIKENPKLMIITISHCRAIDFVNRAIKYDYEHDKMKEIPYKSYNCFNEIE